MGRAGVVKIPREQFDEICEGTGELVDWLSDDDRREALLLDEEAEVERVRRVASEGYASNLDDNELAQISGDAFLISYALVAARDRKIVTFEVPKPSKIRANRKIPDVCASFAIPCCTLYEMVEELDFTTDWQP